MQTKKKNIVVAITGASGSIYAKVFIEKLIALNLDTDISVIFSETGIKVFDFEIGEIFFQDLPVNIYDNSDYYAPFASGSSSPEAMIVIPCTMGTLGRIANGTSDNLICRAADVVLKERKQLIVVPRETPFNLIHIKNMERITLAGGIICPASPSFYSKPVSIEDLVASVCDRILDILGFTHKSFRWGQ